MRPPWERRKPLPRVSPRKLHVLVRVIERTAGGLPRYRRSRSLLIKTRSYREVNAFMDQLLLPWTRSAKLRAIRGGGRRGDH